MKSPKGVKSPNKHTRLDTLLMIQRNHYIGELGQEFYADEVDAVILKKQAENDERRAERLIRQREKHE